MFTLKRKPLSMPSVDQALPGRPQAITTAKTHFVNGAPLKGPYPQGAEMALFGLGCFWGAERKFWQVPGVIVTAVGYAGGLTPNPTYEEVCSGMTGHNEAVFVVYDPKQVSYEELLKLFWETHNPTQGMRQGNDVGTQYRSGIYYYSEAQKKAAEARRRPMDARSQAKGSARSLPRSCRRPNSISPRTITSNISPRIRTAIAGLAAPASPAKSARASKPRTTCVIARLDRAIQ